MAVVLLFGMGLPQFPCSTQSWGLTRKLIYNLPLHLPLAALLPVLPVPCAPIIPGLLAHFSLERDGDSWCWDQVKAGVQGVPQP